MGVVVKNLAKLEEFRRRVDEAASGRLMPIIAKRIGVALMKEVADEFNESRDPYGKPWAPVQRNRPRDVRARSRRAARGQAVRGDKPLIDTGRMRASVIYRTDGSSVRVAIPVEYASYHQYGTRFIPRRQILPEPDTGGLGPRWTGAAERAALSVLREHFGGA